MKQNNWLNIFFVGGTTILGGLINYFYHPLMLKFLSIQEYGEFATLVSMFNILSILVVGLSFFLNREISQNVSNLDFVKTIFLNSIKIFSVVGIFFYLSYFFFIPILENLFKIYNFKLFLIVGVVLITSFLGVVVDAALRALKEFKLLSILQLINPIVKIFFGFLLVYWGYRVLGAILAFVLSNIFGLIVSFYFVYGKLKNYKIVFGVKKLLSNFWKQKADIFSYLFLVILISIFMNIDILLARIIFDPQIVGYYAGVSMVGKFMIFALAAIETVYYPQIMEISKDILGGRKEKSYLILNPLKMYFILGILAILGNLMLGKFILKVLKPELVNYFNYYLMLLFYFWGFAIFNFLAKILVGFRLNWIILVIFFILGGLVLYIKFVGNLDLNKYIFCYILVIWILNLILGSILVKKYGR